MKIFRWQGVIAFAIIGGAVAVFLIMFLDGMTLECQQFQAFVEEVTHLHQFETFLNALESQKLMNLPTLLQSN